MQNKTDKGTSLVSKSLPVANLNSVNRLFSTRKKMYYDSSSGRLCASLSSRVLVGVGCRNLTYNSSSRERPTLSFEFAE